jgi:hypothetical protein
MFRAEFCPHNIVNQRACKLPHLVTSWFGAVVALEVA